jgi:hypothetical protein
MKNKNLIDIYNNILKESQDDFTLVKTPSNKDILNQFQKYEKEPIGYDTNGDPVYVEYDDSKNIMNVKIIKNVELEYDKEMDFVYNIRNLRKKILSDEDIILDDFIFDDKK